MKRPPWLRSFEDFRKFLRRRFTREGALGLYFTLGFLASALLIVLLSLLLDEVFEIGAPGPFDRAVTLAVRNLQSPGLDRFFRNLTNLGDFQTMNEVYASYFKDAPPARSTVQVAALPKGAQVEIEVVAVATKEGGKAIDTWE